jgi:hypothetical protein
MKYPELFKSDSDWKNNACLNFAGDMSIGYIIGYKLAADKLVEYVTSEGKDQDFLVYPITFLYRHHLELLLKSIISNGNELLGTKTTSKLDHGIERLWTEARGLIIKIWKDVPKEIEKIDHFINQFAKVDPSSEAFRYTKTKKGVKTLQGITHINIRHLSECIDSVSEFLDSARMGLDGCLSARDNGH